MTRRDRATVGPEVVATQDAGPVAQPSVTADSGAMPNPSSSSDGLASAVQWDNTQRVSCDAGKPSGCSALAYDALRAQRLTVAVQLFTRACLMDESVVQCAQAGTQSKGLARSCFELAGLLQKQGQADDAKKFKTCACERGYRPACAI